MTLKLDYKTYHIIVLFYLLAGVWFLTFIRNHPNSADEKLVQFVLMVVSNTWTIPEIKQLTII